MLRCPKCSGEAAEGSRFCPSCATPLEVSGSAPTETSVESAAPTAAVPPRTDRDAVTSHPALGRYRFVPGSVLDKRYRIVGLLGRHQKLPDPRLDHQESVSWHPLPQLLEEVEEEIDLVWSSLGALEEHESPVRGWSGPVERTKHSVWPRDSEGRASSSQRTNRQRRAGIDRSGEPRWAENNGAKVRPSRSAAEPRPLLPEKETRESMEGRAWHRGWSLHRSRGCPAHWLADRPTPRRHPPRRCLLESGTRFDGA